MDDLLLLRELRDEVPEADPVALMRARSRLLERAARPHGVVRRARRPPRPAVAAIVAVIAVASVVALDLVRLGDRSVGASAEAASLLRGAAQHAIAKDPVVRPNQYRKVTTSAVWSGTAEIDGRLITWLDKEVIEVWIPGDASREWVMRRSGRVPWRFFHPGDEQAVRDAGLHLLEKPEPKVFRAKNGAFYGPVAADWTTPTPEFLAQLPRDPEQLLARIYRDSQGGGPSKDGEALVYIADFLRWGTVPADLRAAVFQAAALIDGVEVIDRRANLEGRVGVAVGRDESRSGLRQEIIFDPGSGEFIGEREVVLTDEALPGVPAGTALGLTAVRTEVVDDTP
jgi:RNA polymerase sigma-70 factor (ECF subfamily)